LAGKNGGVAASPPVSPAAAGTQQEAWERRRAAVKSQALARLGLTEVVPWPEPVNGAALLDAIVRELERFVVLPKWAGVTLALWILHTYAFLLREVTTYIGIESPEKECGKSTLLMALSKFVARPAVSSSISPSAFFRVIHDVDPTLLIDQGDTNLRSGDELTGICNGGYTKATAFVWRMCYDPLPEEEAGEPESGGGGWSSAGHAERYSTWCPKAIATIGALEPTLASRCIVFWMHRKTGEEECERLKYLDTTELKRKCARFVADHAAEIAQAEPKIPTGLTNRAADIWEPLLVLADLAGGRWPALAREAAMGLTARAQGHSPIASLLLDIFLAFCFANRDRLFSRELVGMLIQNEERPWAVLRKGKPVTETWLAQQLQPYGVTPKTMRIGEQVGRGYEQEDFRETLRRYVPKSDVEALKADLAARTVKEQGAQATGETSPAVQGPGQGKTEIAPAPGSTREAAG